MSLREALRNTLESGVVARCAPLATQRATNDPERASGAQHGTQQRPASPRESSAPDATGRATITQQTCCATPENEGPFVARFAPVARTCANCLNRLKHGTCSEPVAAGLAPKFEIRWAPVGHAKDCPAYSAMTPTPAQDRPYRLSKDAADRCHLSGWNDAEIELFTTRTLHFIRRGITAGDADDLAESLVLRDRDGDDLRLCLECQHYRPAHCGNHRAAGLNSPELGRVLAATLQRCPGFEPVS